MNPPAPDVRTEEVAEVRLVSDFPQIPDLPASALWARLARALPLLSEDPERARAILAASPSPSSHILEA